MLFGYLDGSYGFEILLSPRLPPSLQASAAVLSALPQLQKNKQETISKLEQPDKERFLFTKISNTCIFYMWLKINNIALHQNHHLKNLFSWVLSQDVVKFIQYKGNVSPLWSWMEDNSPNIWRLHSMQYISNIYPI